MVEFVKHIIAKTAAISAVEQIPGLPRIGGVNGEIHLHNVVVLTGDVRAKHFESGRPLLLRRGQVGTVVMTYDGTAFEVEFAGKDVRAYALLPIAADKLIVLRDEPQFAAA